MTPDQAKARHAKLAAEIRLHDHAYYVLAKPLILDSEYDKLYNELLTLEKQFPKLVTPESPSQRVGGTPIDGFKKVKHIVPMLSLEKIEASEKPDQNTEPDRERRSRQQDEQTLEKFKDFDAGIRDLVGKDRIEYVLEPKVDGVSISVHYRNGKLGLGVTRGDGDTGDDITANIKTIGGIPLLLRGMKLPSLLEVRGEAYIATKDFEKLNAMLVTDGEETFPNPRNATAGTLKQLDPRLVAKRPISAVFYAVGACEGVSFKTHSEMLTALKDFGLPTQTVWWVCEDINEVLKVYTKEVVCHYDEKRDLRTKVPYEIDGIVVKVNNTADAKRIPTKTRVPGNAIVHKPIPWITPAETVLRAITIQVGRTGVLTPVAELEPVSVQGSTISRATLHNEEEIRRKDIRIGDTVVIRKAGMVIPEVLEVMKSRRSQDATEFDLFEHVQGKCPACREPIQRDPRFLAATCGHCGAEIRDPKFDLKFVGAPCPNCGKDVKRNAKYANWLCNNIVSCPAQKVRRVEFFAQRKALDIESLGGIVAEKLVERNLVEEPLDLFSLTIDQLGDLNLGTKEDRRVFGKKNATKVVETLKRSRKLPLSRWLFALAIPGVGEVSAYELGKLHPDFKAVSKSKIICDFLKLHELVAEAKRVNPDARMSGNKIRRKDERTREDEAEIDRRTKRHQELNALIESLSEQLRQAGVKVELKRKQKKSGKPPLIEITSELEPETCKSVLAFFSSEYGKRVLGRMKQLRISPKRETGEVIGGAAAQSLSGKTFVLTGELKSMEREKAIEEIRSRGGNVTSSVSKSTSFLVVGEKVGAAKSKAAQALGVLTLNEDKFLEMLGLNANGKSSAQKQQELFKET